MAEPGPADVEPRVPPLAPRHVHSEAAQVDPIKPKWKAPGTGTKRLKLNCDTLLSTSAFKFNLRRYTTDIKYGVCHILQEGESMYPRAGAYTRPHFGST